jgi:hypothetical protein
MSLLNQSVQVYGQIGNFFSALQQGQAPDKFTREFLKDKGFKSSNHLAFIPLLKGLGFLTADGSPTQRYRDLLDETKWRKVLAKAVREAYSDIFVLKARPTKADRKMIAGKFKSTYNLSETAADRAAGTFLALLELADENTLYGNGDDGAAPSEPEPAALVEKTIDQPLAMMGSDSKRKEGVGLHYNIQIHLPATKDIEVYNAIFKSVREHLIE